MESYFLQIFYWEHFEKDNQKLTSQNLTFLTGQIIQVTQNVFEIVEWFFKNCNWSCSSEVKNSSWKEFKCHENNLKKNLEKIECYFLRIFY